MRILNIVTGDVGGGGKAAYRLNLGLRRLGCEATLYVASKFHPDPTTVVYRPSNNYAAKLGRLARRIRQRARLLPYRNRTDLEGAWSMDHQCQRGADPVTQIPPADIVNIHTISNFMNYDALFRSFPARVPMVWTLHIMAPFTGGCYCSYDCRRFENSCGCCPILESQNERDLSHSVWKEKRDAYAGIDPARIHLVSPSRWLANGAKKSALFKRFPISVIPNGVDTDVYSPRDRRFAREVLGLAPDAAVVLFVTQHSFGYKLKGFPLLAEALAGMTQVKNLHLLTLGAGSPLGLPVKNTHLGHVFDDHLLSMIYSAADVFVIPSLQENLPNVVLESIACGTPVVSFDTGGIPEMVRPGITGNLAPVGDVRAMREAIVGILENRDQWAGLSANCRRIALEEYSLARQAGEYLKIYEGLRNKRESGYAG